MSLTYLSLFQVKSEMVHNESRIWRPYRSCLVIKDDSVGQLHFHSKLSKYICEDM